MAASGELTELGAGWLRLLAAGLKADGWGQIVEAVGSYEKLSANVVANIDALKPDATLRAVLNKLVLCVNLRASAIQGGKNKAPTKEQMESLVPFLKGLFSGDAVAFPIDTSRYRTGSMTAAESKGTESESKGGTLMAPPKLRAGETFLSFDVDKWGLKDAETYVDPRVNVCVFDEDGNPLEDEQETPIAHTKHGMHVHFGHKVYLQTSVKTMISTNAAIFFEFKHWKPKKKKLSTRCFCFLEMDELKEGPVALELYTKPTDPKRKKLKLHTIKPLYLHLNVTFHTI